MKKKLLKTMLSPKSFLLSASILMAVAAQAQTATLYRLNVIISTHTTIAGALAAASANDSISLSAHTFKENNLTINKNLRISGIKDASGISTVDAELKNRALLITSGNVELADIAFINGKTTNDAGGGICNYGTGTLSLIGNTSVKSSSCNGIYASGGGIFSTGKLTLTDNVLISDNFASEDGGGVFANSTFVLAGHAKIQNNKTTGSGGGLFSVANGAVSILNNASIEYNTAGEAGGGMFGAGTLMGNASIANNTAMSGGGVATFKDLLVMRDSAMIIYNTATQSGAGVWLNNADFNGAGRFQIVGNKITATSGTTNFGAAIYNVNGDIQISGGAITGNQSQVAAIYNSSSLADTRIQINSCHLFNPKIGGGRIPEVVNRPAFPSSDTIYFSSDSCYWGQNNITSLYVNAPGTIMPVAPRHATLKWWLNNGVPVTPGATKILLQAYFFLDIGDDLNKANLRSIRGNFAASNGSFLPASAAIDNDNIVSSIYTPPITEDSILITAIVDADTFRSSKIGLKGLSIKNNTSASSIKIYPNPASEIIYISNAQEGSTVTIISLEGRTVAQQKTENNVAQINVSQLSAGVYIIQLTDDEGQKVSARIVKQ